MKGIFVHNQVEYRLEVVGDEFWQGDSLQCTLSVKNHSPSARIVDGVRLDLVLASLSKIKQKTEGSFAIVSSADAFDTGELAAGEQKSMSCVFQLDVNCPITDKAQSLCLLFGANDSLEATNFLVLSINPQRYIPHILAVLENFFQFVSRGTKSSDGWVQAKFKPPSSRKFSLLDELTLCLRFEDEMLVMKYVFKVKRFDATVASVTVKKGKVELEQRLSEREYLLSPDYVNHPGLESKIGEALEVVATEL